MIPILCVDDRGGVMFNHRRLSRDRLLRRHLLDMLAGKTLWMNRYSREQFTETSAAHLVVDEDFLSLAGSGARALYDAVLEDAAALRLYCWDPFAPSQGSSLGTLEFTFQREDPASDRRTYISVDLYTGMTSTFRVLQELGWTYAGAVDADLAA